MTVVDMASVFGGRAVMATADLCLIGTPDQARPSDTKTAATIEELALRAGLSSAALKETVGRHNEFGRKGVDEDFDRFGPGKPFQPKPIAMPPFYALQQFPITRKSIGGVIIDTGCCVETPDQRAIAGLYAAGEVTGVAGINGKAGLEGTLLGPSIVTGRVTGRIVVKDLGREAGSSTAPARRPNPEVTPDPLASTPLCLSCHDLPKRVPKNRPGYWHFERVHREELTENLECLKCHADMSATFHPEKHRINRLAQIASCATCHRGEDR